MISSQSIVIGQSFLASAHSMNIDELIGVAEVAVQKNPEVAAEITLATTEQVLLQFGAQDSLRIQIQNMVHRLCLARDASVCQ